VTDSNFLSAGLAELLGDADRIAVIDVETTGLGKLDRVVEIAIVTMDRSGTVVDEFECLTNPMRDPGPSWVHKITSSMLRDAPMFEEIADHVATILHGAVVAAHNLPFDRRLLGYEFDRTGIDIDWGDGLDTCRAAGNCKLGKACADYGIPLHGAHAALQDARATAQLLIQVAGFFDRCRPAAAQPLSGSTPRVLTRQGFTAVNIQSPFIAQLAHAIHSSEDLAPYVVLLDHAVADLKLDSDERRELAMLAGDLGLSEHSRKRAHMEFLIGLIEAAIDDNIVTDDEFDQLCRVAALLEIEDKVVTARTNAFRLTADTLDLSPGLQICFTGSASTPEGVPIERADLQAHARLHNLDPVDSVTIKNCQLLVAADPATLSNKGKSAQKLGIPIASVTDYFAAFEKFPPSLEVIRLPIEGKGLACSICGQSWIATRREKDPVCKTCRVRQIADQ
jgi:DNA polymerase-3 subunit epsilon